MPATAADLQDRRLQRRRDLITIPPPFRRVRHITLGAGEWKITFASAAAGAPEAKTSDLACTVHQAKLDSTRLAARIAVDVWNDKRFHSEPTQTNMARTPQHSSMATAMSKRMPRARFMPTPSGKARARPCGGYPAP